MKKNELQQYIDLIESFVAGTLTASEFERSYLAMFKSDQRMFPEDVFDVLNELFSAVDCFTANLVEMRKENIDEFQLLAASKEALQKIMQLVD